MRIWFWAGTFAPSIGGVETFNRLLVEGLSQRGHRLTVFTDEPNAEADWQAQLVAARSQSSEGFQLVRLPFGPALRRRDLELMAGLKAQLRQLRELHQPALDHVSCLGTNGFFLDSRHCPIISLHQAPRGEGLICQVLRRARRICVVSRALAGELSGHFDSQVIYPGLPTPPAWTPAELPDTWLCLGRLVPEKGFELALRALALARQRRPQLRLWVAGDGPCRAELEQESARLGLDEAVRFLGWVDADQVDQLCRQVSGVLAPSRAETLGFSVLQAAAQGRPAVAAHLGGLKEAVEHGRTGTLVEGRDPKEWADAWVCQSSRLETSGRAAAARVAKKFSRSRFLDDYEELYSWASSSSTHSSKQPS